MTQRCVLREVPQVLDRLWHLFGRIFARLALHGERPAVFVVLEHAQEGGEISGALTERHFDTTTTRQIPHAIGRMDMPDVRSELLRGLAPRSRSRSICLG